MDQRSDSRVVKEADFQQNGRSIHYRAVGSGPPLVLVHGYPESSRTWEKLMVRLARLFTIIAPDTRGTGESSITEQFSMADVADDLSALLRHLGYNKIFLVGQDFGVQFASAYAALHREDILGLAVIESPLSAYGLEDLYPTYWHFGFLASQFAEMLISGHESEFFRKFAFGDFVYRKEAFTQAKIDGYVADQMRPGRLKAGISLYQALASGEEFFRDTVVPPWSFPVLAIDGDHGMNGLTGKSFAKIAPNLRTEIAPDCGHFVQEEQPDFLANVLSAFLRDRV